MDWQKLNMDEVIYYCKSFDDVGFDCSPFSLQMEEIVIIFSYYGIERFTVDDIKEFYKIMQIPKMKSEGIIKPAPGKIQKVAERMKNIRCTGDGVFEIIPADRGLYLPFDTGIYLDYIEEGYKKGRILSN